MKNRPMAPPRRFIPALAICLFLTGRAVARGSAVSGQEQAGGFDTKLPVVLSVMSKCKWATNCILGV